MHLKSVAAELDYSKLNKFYRGVRLKCHVSKYSFLNMEGIW